MLPNSLVTVIVKLFSPTLMLFFPKMPLNIEALLWFAVAFKLIYSISFGTTAVYDLLSTLPDTNSGESG